MKIKMKLSGGKMELGEFEEKIEEVESMVLEIDIMSGYLCNALGFIFNNMGHLRTDETRGTVAKVFTDLFEPSMEIQNNLRLDFYHRGFFNTPSREVLPLRPTALYLFKEHCISLKLYKEF